MTKMTKDEPLVGKSALSLEARFEGQLWRVRLDRPKANIIDSEMIAALDALFERAAEAPSLKLITIEGEGKHFSFGASVEEHLPERCASMLKELHSMLIRLNDSHVVCHALVRGQCLGAGLELASFCHRIIASPEAQLGQPEIKLGVFAPVASAILAERVGRGAAEDLCLSGRSLSAQEAQRLGLVDEIAQDPWEAARAYFEQHLAPSSASSLRHAVRALRADFSQNFQRRIAQLELLYLEELMGSQDALEGLTAFIEKRRPQWRNE